MRLSRIVIKNFRNFKLLDVRLGEHAVVLGENKVGKTNLLFALQLLLRPCEVSSGIANASVLEVAHHTQRVLLQHRHVVVRGFA